MGKNYDWKIDFSNKSEEELFNIYLGSPHHFPKNMRYYAGRILEGRDFQFDQINQYKKEWELEKQTQKSPSVSAIFSNFTAFLGYHTQEITKEKNIVELSH